VDEILFQVLAEGIGRYLASVERLAGAQPSVAATELRRLAAAWRALLGMHEPAGRRRCSGCRRRDGMCSVWRVAGAYFVRKLRD
jgi:phage gp37-like protein